MKDRSNKFFINRYLIIKNYLHFFFLRVCLSQNQCLSKSNLHTMFNLLSPLYLKYKLNISDAFSLSPICVKIIREHGKRNILVFVILSLDGFIFKKYFQNVL